MSKVHYLTPRMSDRRRTRLQSSVQLRHYLATTKSNLSIENFTFEPKPLGLDQEHEVKREAKTKECVTFENPAIRRFCNELGGKNGSKNRKGACSLCEGHSSQTGIMTFKSFQKHMLVHLPDEVCEICGEEIPAQCFTEHWNHCGLETRREMLEDDCTRHTDSCPRNIYWMEAPSGSSNNLGTDGGQKCKRGRCLHGVIISLRTYLLISVIIKST